MLKTNGKKWSNSEVSVLQGNRGRFTQYLTQCLKHTVVFPHKFYPPEHSEEHTADNNARSIIHSLPNFISSPLFLSVRTHAVHVRSQRAAHTYTKRATSRAHTPHRPETVETHTRTDGVMIPGGAAVNELLLERSPCDARRQQRRGEGGTGRRPHFIILEGDRAPRGTEW